MGLKTKKSIVVAALEANYGVDENPGGADAVLISKPKITPLAAGTVSRDNSRPYLGNDQQIHVGVHVQVGFMVEIAGADGAVDDEPPWAILLKACGFTGAPNVGVDYTVTPISDNEPSLTLYFFQDDQKHAMLGARGTVSIEFNKNSIPYFNFQFKGLWVDPETVSAPTPNFNGWAEPIDVSRVNTPTVTLGGYDCILEQLTLNMAVKVEHSDRPNEEVVKVVDRTPAGSIKFVAPVLSTENFFTSAKANTLSALQIVHGTASGNIVSINVPRAQLLQPDYGDADGEVTLDANLSLIPTDAGNDEISIVTT
ncbi:MAG: hypothetical protein JAY88_14765 [Candidatus Thiodiazotropha lotti]|nr:hypothetical protein [Candidatus Thiodiazotropha lotti]MCW4188326.1 hypothetical protein [Candidatus Thiodiazotropha lotti]